MKDRVWSSGKFTLHIQPALAPQHYEDLKQFCESQRINQSGQWQPTQEGDALIYQGQGKFDEYIVCLKDLIEHFLQPWGYVLDGATGWEREDGAVGFVAVKANQVQAFRKK